MEKLRCVLISLAGYEQGMLEGHCIVTLTPQDGDRESLTLDLQVPAPEDSDDNVLWARRVLAAALAEL